MHEGKGWGGRGAHHEPILGTCLGGGRPERRIDGEGRSYHPWRLEASILADPAEERLGWRLGKAEEVVENFYVQGIEARRPEGGDRMKGAAGNELSSALSEGRRKRELSDR